MANEEKLAKIRHSMAHVMAEAVLEIFPDAQIAIGPSIENGFYYDFDMWQYSDSGDVDGIDGNVDLNISFKDYSVR